MTPQHGVKKGMEPLGEAGAKAVLKELEQLNNTCATTSASQSKMMKAEVVEVLSSLVFLKRKRHGKIKA